MSIRDEAGIGLVELMVAVLVLTTGILAFAGTLDVSRRLTSQAERQNSAVHTAEREIERIQALPFRDVALSQQPATSVLTGVAASEPLVVTTDGAIQPGPDAGAEGSVLRYVTSVSDASCGAACTDGKLKRVTVISTASTDGRKRTFRMSALISDPDTVASNATAPPQTECLGENATPIQCAVGVGETATWYLTDAPVSSAARQPVGASHGTHATVAAEPGSVAPDLLSSEPSPAAQTAPALFNYSTDVVSGGSFPGGRALRRDTACSGTPSATDKTKGAVWSTTPLASALAFTGHGGFSLGTQTFEGVEASVALCAAFYDLPGGTSQDPAPASSEIARVSYSRASWPANLTQLAFSFELGGEVTLQAGRRLAVRLWVTEGSGADIVLAYDHPSYPSHLQLATASG